MLRAAGGGPGFEQLVQYAWSVGGDIIDADAAATRLAEQLPQDSERIMKTIAEQFSERGMKRGRVLAQHAAVRAVLATRFGPLPADVDAGLARCTEPVALDRLVVAAATAATLADFVRAPSV